ncbi:PITH domain-containing protein 1 [Dermatophagoides pteronyssinus]|uniref:PITH domain-containing protein 1-like n=2 Tax=Dermatophagoides pteronyssinus TaxID=6956 RepID=A0A6P6Y997_DERPT|nr:PITH domain-containing protein 1-like [Dermatophagoides pteronyssinus]KAH9424675.1 PITH domain-containing protein 1 [Dermatophagoides pteronyssinus]
MSKQHHCDHNCNGHNSLNDPENLGILYSLYTKIDLSKLECLNETVEGSGRLVFKPWEERLNMENFVESDCDEELLFKIPFTGNIKLKGIIIIGGEDETHPSRLRIYKNRPDMSFDDVSVEADQEFEIMQDQTGTLEYPLKIVKFSNVFHLTIHIPKNYGANTTKVYYIGLRGEFSPTNRDAILIANYELAPNPADCKNGIEETMFHQVH